MASSQHLVSLTFVILYQLLLSGVSSSRGWSGAFFREKVGLSSRHLEPTCSQAHPVAPCFLLTDTLGHKGRTKMKTQQARHCPLSTTLQTWLAIVLFSARVQAHWDSGGGGHPATVSPQRQKSQSALILDSPST